MIPQEETLDRLCDRFVAGSLPASLLFVGPRGVGKWSVAFELARRITCAKPSGRRGCGECPSCRQLDQFAHPDVQFLFPLPANENDWENWYFPYLTARKENPFSPSSADAKHFIPIEAIRQFQSKLARRSTLSPFKVGIIYEAERMLPGTMDSLLKLLEEPPDKCFLIVVTHEPRFLLPTIMSRLQRVNLPALRDDYIRAHIGQTYKLQGEQLEALVRFARGQLYDVDTILQGDFMQMRDSALDMLDQSLRLSESEIYLRVGDGAALATREKVEALLRHWQNILRDLMVCGQDSSGNLESSRLINYDFAERYSALRENLADLERIEALSDRIEAIRQELRRNVNPRMAAISFLTQLAPREARRR